MLSMPLAIATLACSAPASKETTVDGASASSERVATHEHRRLWYRDEDGDGYGDPERSRRDFTRPPGFAVRPGDCDDLHAEAHPGATERRTDGLDTDCDGATAASRVSKLPVWEAVGSDSGAELGITLATDADLNGDGIADLVLGGQYGHLDADPRMSTVMVFEGPLDVTAEPLDESAASVRLYGAMFSGPTVVCSVGDLDADGSDDLVVGSPSGGVSGTGIAYIARGPLSGVIDLTVGTQSYEGSGVGEGLGACAGPGDVDGDGFPDVVLAASDFNGGAGRGTVYLLRGPTEHASLDDADQVLAGTDDQEFIGMNIAALGDLNGDGTGDYGVSNAWGSHLPSDGISTYLMTDYAPGTAHPRDVGVTVHDGFRTESMVPNRLGDVDGDGYDDVAFGADESSRSHRLLALLGPFDSVSSVDLSAEYDIAFESSVEAPSWLSFAGALGDWNGDGTGVLAIADAGFTPEWARGTPRCGAGDCSYGALFLMAEPIAPGAYDLVVDADRIEGPSGDSYMGGGWFGPTFQGGSDLNADGSPDLAFSAWRSAVDGSYLTGAAYVLFGDGSL